MTTNNILYFLHAPQSAIHPWPIEVHGILAHNLINLPTCILLGKIAINCLKDYEKQRKEGINPIFKASSIGLDEKELDSWKWLF